MKPMGIEEAFKASQAAVEKFIREAQAGTADDEKAVEVNRNLRDEIQRTSQDVIPYLSVGHSLPESNPLHARE